MPHQLVVPSTDQAGDYGHSYGVIIADAIKIEQTANPPGTTQAEIHYIHSDHLNTPQRITNTAQQTVWAADYQPFGQASITTASITNPLRFPGQYYDEETNLHYNYFRDYDPTTGRYIQSDPIGLAGGMNTYGYVGGNPTRFVDALGLWSPSAHDKILDRAFQNQLSSSDIRRLQQASRDFDRRTQSNDQSHMHSMARSGQNIQDAIRMREQFINDTLGMARLLAVEGNRNAALDRLGEACHSIMDSSSPMHTDPSGDPRTWNPWWPFGHSPNEFIGNETVNDLTPVILEQQRLRLNEAYNKVFR